MTRRGISRRTFLASSVAASGVAAAGYWYWSGSGGDDQSSERPTNSRGIIPSSEPLALVNGKLLDTDFPDPFAGGELLGYLPFELEGPAPPFNRKSDAGHNSRLIIDVASLLMPQSRVTPPDYFFVRTEYPDMLRVPDDWTIKIGGYVKK